jgi:hypothetical protein
MFPKNNFSGGILQVMNSTKLPGEDKAGDQRAG